MNFKTQVEKIKSTQEELIKNKKIIEKECKQLEKSLEKFILNKLKKSFPDVEWKENDWLVGVFTGCMTDRWEPGVWFYSVGGKEVNKKNIWYDDIADYSIEDYPNLVKVKAPIPTKKFLDFLKQLSEEIGIKCKLSRRRYELHTAHQRD